MDFKNIISQSNRIREKYHTLEEEIHGSKWTIEEDALAFLTDAGLVGRLTMDNQKRWPVSGDGNKELEHKLAECIWWLVILAKRMDIDIEKCVSDFLNNTEHDLVD